jgi:pSer/pThr/pTyr-binding forkhead associated (FHA) protein
MPAQDQLEIITPSGDIRFYDLDPRQGIANIGRHPDNDIVIDSLHVAPFHAVLDYSQKP